jgi:uncharacterized tellurite resistance protein B-like protein
MRLGFTVEEMAALDDDQRTAIMESLMVAVFADGQTPRAETTAFDAAVAAIPWGLDRARLIEALSAIRLRILAFRDQEEAIALIASVGRRLPDPELREKVFHAMGVIMFADDRLDRGEINVLGKYATAFGLSRERLDLLRNAIEVTARTLPRPSAS